MSELSELGKALLELNEEKVYLLVRKKLEAGESADRIIHECNSGMVEVGARFERGEYYISELVMSGEILASVMKELGPLLGSVQQGPSLGKVVIGTVKGDIHDIGKNIVVMFLKGSGFEVIDLGVDVPAEVFVKTVKKEGAKVVGLSVLLNSMFTAMKDVVDKLVEAGLRDQVKVLIGGSPCNEDVRRFTGADYYAKDASEGARICKEIYS
ncbi:MAG: corrinoid protein [Desulfobacterales bacterium]|nr:corrinoid protein [Desulfobacterales bacterium]